MYINLKALDRVCHDGLIYKIKSFVISYTLLKEVSAVVPQGSILGPLLFLMYIDDLGSGLSLSNKLFADDISLFLVVHSVTQSTTKLNHIDKKQKNSLEDRLNRPFF